MLEANETQGAQLSTDEMGFRNDLNTLVRIEERIQSSPGVLADPSMRRVHEKARAALDSVQEFSDQVHFIRYDYDGTPHDVTMTVQDYAGPARMTSATIDSLQRIVGYHRHDQ